MSPSLRAGALESIAEGTWVARAVYGFQDIAFPDGGVAVRRSPLLIPLALALALAAPPAAHAGGFATAGISSTPDRVAAGQPWTVHIEVLQHGRTPAEGLRPRIVIRSGDAVREFAAAPTGRPGVYRANVVFPAAGTWRYEVFDGFNDALPHRFTPVRIAER